MLITWPIRFGLVIQEFYLFHFALAILTAKVSIVFDHLRVSVAEPLSDLPFRRAAEEALATEEVPE